MLNDLWKFDGVNWTWVAGSDELNQFGIYGVKGVTSESSYPGARFGSTTWFDSLNNLYLFGGYGYGKSGDYEGI